ncbi:TPA: restriction endonuclease subunit S [Photobacterium damselae]
MPLNTAWYPVNSSISKCHSKNKFTVMAFLQNKQLTAHESQLNLIQYLQKRHYNEFEVAMKVNLKKIASVQMGHSFRSKLEPDANGNISVIQMKDLTEDNRLNAQELVQITMQDLKEHHRVKHNDLVFRSRGQTNTAALIDQELNDAVIAAPLLRIRVENDSVIPAYLCWFINQPSSQAVLQSKAAGTAVRMIGKPALEDLEIVLPSLDVQKKIIEIYQLSINEQKLMNALAKKKRTFTESILMNLAMDTL